MVTATENGPTIFSAEPTIIGVIIASELLLVPN